MICHYDNDKWIAAYCTTPPDCATTKICTDSVTYCPAGWIYDSTIPPVCPSPHGALATQNCLSDHCKEDPCFKLADPTCASPTVEPVAGNLVANAGVATKTANDNLADPTTINKYPLLTGYSVIVIAVAKPVKTTTGSAYKISLDVLINAAVQPTPTHLTAVCEAYIKVYVAKSLNIEKTVLNLDCSFTANTLKRSISQGGNTDFSYKSSVDVPASALQSSNSGTTAVISFVAALLAVIAAMF
jgi:hypothetical protein